VRYPNLVCGITPTPQPRDYFWDGLITAYQTNDASATQAPTKSWIFASMRRGGRSIYALDVTDPDNPKFKWRISNTDADFLALQQTWSEPKVVRVRGKVAGVSTTKIVLIFGSGYATDEEDKASGSARTSLTASGVYVVDADTGARLAFIEQPAGVHKYSFAADVTLADIDRDGAVDRLYAVDTGGNLFRFDANTSAAPGASWTSYLIAQVGDVGNNGGTDARKFLFPPELVGFTDPVTLLPGMAVFLGSGDREHPLQHPVAPTCPAYYGGSASLGSAVQDGFFAIMDKVQSGADAATVNASPIVLADLLLTGLQGLVLTLEQRNRRTGQRLGSRRRKSGQCAETGRRCS
jgi:type IV pilus assembly protein PilY1